LYCDLFVDAILSGIEKRLGGAAAKKADADVAADADEIEDAAKEREAKQKSKASEGRAERREKKADK
jgi:hypothetical protein